MEKHQKDGKALGALHHAGDPDETLDYWLHHGLAPSVVAMWGKNKQTDFFLSVTLPFE